LTPPPTGRPRGGSVTKKYKKTPCPPCPKEALRRETFVLSKFFMEGVQTESIHDCFYTAVKLYYQKTREGQYNSSCVLVKILNLFHFLVKNTEIFRRKKPFSSR
jgi:hypothetical protein